MQSRFYIDILRLKMTRNEQIIEYRQQGKTLQEIGEIVGVSHQRVSQLIKSTGYRRAISKGYFFDQKTNEYIAKCYANKSEGRVLGRFKTPEEATFVFWSFQKRWLLRHPAEEWASKKLQKFGLHVEYTPYKFPYDLLVNGFLKVEIKHVSHASISNYTITPNDSDFLIIIVGDLGDETDAYVFPLSKWTKHVTLKTAYVNKTNKNYYLNKWSLLIKKASKFDNLFKRIAIEVSRDKSQ